MRSVVVAIPVTVFLLSGCHRDPAALPPPGRTQNDKAAEKGKEVVRLNVAADGKITADGQLVSLNQLATKLSDLKKAGGNVLYHRENPAGDPHPNAMKVIQLVGENRLPVRLSAKPDFSDAVDDKGVSHSGER